MNRHFFLSIILLSLLLFSCSNLSEPKDSSSRYAKIYGYVFDYIINTPVPETNIIIAQNGFQTKSDSAGFFQIDSLDPGYYTLFAIRAHYYSDSLNIYLKSSEVFQTNLTISYIGLYAITDSIVYSIANNHCDVKVKIVNNASYHHYLWWWCDIMFGSYRLVDNIWESYSARPCLQIYAPELIEIAPGDSIITQIPISDEGKFYTKFPYRLSAQDLDRELYSNVFEVTKK